MHVDPMEDILSDVRAGRPVVVVDDTDRENEGDLCLAAERVTPESMAFLIREARGLICLSLEQERLNALRIPMQVSQNTARFGTNFTVSIDHASAGENGVTASARAKAVLRAMSDDASPSEFRMPGYVFPLRAEPGGVLKRRGQTEAVVDLARLAGLKPGGVICEAMGPDGKMLRGASLSEFCKRWNLKLTSVEAICQWRLRNEVSLRRVAECSLLSLMESPASPLRGIIPPGAETPRRGGDFRVVVYVDDVDGQEHLAFVRTRPDRAIQSGCVVRIHSECLTGDVFGSRRCDCGFQLRTALELIEREGEGALLYLHQEGRGIGLGNKLRAYALQEQGLDTVDANLQLGFRADSRNYRVAYQMLSDLGIAEVHLITNNPAKIRSLEEFGVKVVDRIPLEAPRDSYNRGYLETKRDRMGHLLR